MLTSCAGDARRLAKTAVLEGFETVIAAGGDGTVNEVLNGLGDAPQGFQRARLAVLPLGTVNVFARELSIPAKLDRSWDIIMRGKEIRIDLPRVEFCPLSPTPRLADSPAPPFTSPPSSIAAPLDHLIPSEFRHFAQLAGAGLDGRAIELVNWPLKKKIGALAYVLAGVQALAGPAARITARTEGKSVQGGLVLVGNGCLYGGPFRLFPQADLSDGLLEVCVFPRVNWLTLARCGPGLLLRRRISSSVTSVFRAERFTLESAPPAPLEVDGELIGRLPATFSVAKHGLRVIAP